MRVWFNGNFENVEMGQRFFVGRCGSGHTVFGEYATLTGTTTKHLVFTTESGSIIKTSIDNIHKVVGKAGREGYFVSPKTEDREFIRERVKYWNTKKCCFEYK